MASSNPAFAVFAFALIHGQHQEAPDEHHHVQPHSSHEEHVESNILALAEDLDVEHVAYMLVALLLFTAACSFVLHLLRRQTAYYPHYHAMIDKVTDDLAVLGLISFAIAMLSSFGVVTHSAVLVTFEFTHILVFFFACILVCQS